MEAIELYVFPLPDVILYPRVSMPLHIFEPRYLQMMNDAFATGTRIAMSRVDPTRVRRTPPAKPPSGLARALEGRFFFPARSDLAATAKEATETAPRRPPARPRPRLVVGYGRPELVHRRADGTMAVLLHGEGKARLGEVLRSRPYISCEALPIEENLALREGNRFVLNRMRRHYHAWLDENVADEMTRSQLLTLPTDPARCLDVIAMVMLREAETQQSVLELDDVNERLEFLRQMFLDKN